MRATSNLRGETKVVVTRRTTRSTVFFRGGHVTVHEEDAPDGARTVVVKVYGVADRVSTPSHAGDGPVVLEMRGER